LSFRPGNRGLVLAKMGEEKWRLTRHVVRKAPCHRRKEFPVEDQDKIQSDEDVEAHKKPKHIKATDEGSEEGSEDFELHKKAKHIKATDEGGESSDDDFELHRRRS
jgi:hypothetical protein